MNLIAKSFIFNGQQLPNGYALCALDSVDAVRELPKRTLNKSELTPFRNKANLYNTQYEDVLRFTVSLIKCKGGVISNEEYDTLVQWLTSPITYCDFEVIDFDGETYHQDVIYHAICTGYDEFATNTVRGLTFYFECNSPYGYSRLQTVTLTGGQTTTINNQTEEKNEDIYPLIILNCGATGEVTITNSVYPDKQQILQCLSGQELSIDNENGLIIDNFDMFTFEDTNLGWISLAPGINNITITGNASGTLTYEYPRKRGI